MPSPTPGDGYVTRGSCRTRPYCGGDFSCGWLKYFLEKKLVFPKQFFSTFYVHFLAKNFSRQLKNLADRYRLARPVYSENFWRPFSTRKRIFLMTPMGQKMPLNRSNMQNLTFENSLQGPFKHW